MTIDTIAEYPPLLNPGFYHLSIEDLHDLCVTQFPKSNTRSQIMDGLKELVAAVRNVSIPCEIWVDGSFLTQKNDPKDVDIVVKFAANIVDSGNEEQKEIISWISSNLRNEIFCDSYVLPIYNSDDPLSVCNDYYIAYWIRQYGFSRGHNLKGIAVIVMGGES